MGILLLLLLLGPGSSGTSYGCGCAADERDVEELCNGGEDAEADCKACES